MNEEEEFNQILNNALDKMLGKKENMLNLIDNLAKVDPSYKCLQASTRYNQIDSEVLNLVNIKNSEPVRQAYINLIGQFSKILLDFKKEYLEKRK